MGLFGSRNKSSPPARVVRPIVVQPADLPGFSARLEAVLRAMGSNDSAMRGAIQALSESVGGMDPRRAIQLEHGSEEIKRPWRWFARACELANEQGEYGISPRVFMFTDWFKYVLPKVMFQDCCDLWMGSVPSDAYQAISQAAAEAIAQLPDEHTVAQTAAEVVTVGQIRGLIQAAVAA